MFRKRATVNDMQESIQLALESLRRRNVKLKEVDIKYMVHILEQSLRVDHLGEKWDTEIDWRN